jgi:hypothetical protein
MVYEDWFRVWMRLTLFALLLAAFGLAMPFVIASVPLVIIYPFIRLHRMLRSRDVAGQTSAGCAPH